MLYSSTNIPYQEYRAISELMNAHPQELNGRLRALIAFGEIVATGDSYDINLLEVVDGWQGQRHVSYSSTASLPLRGRLHLYFLTPEDFEHPADTVLELLMQVRQAYAILLEEPNDYAYQVMSQLEDVSARGMEEVDSADPVSFLQKQVLTRAGT